MYQGKRVAKRSAAKLSKKSIAVIGVLALVMVAVIGGTIAFLADSTTAITNVFTPGKITTDVDEEFGNNVKSSIKVANTGDTSAYIRVAVVGYWCEKDSNDKEVIVDSWTLDAAYVNTTDWVIGDDGYYYHKAAVASNGTTAELLTTAISGVDATRPGQYLVVNVIQQSIQAEPETAVEGAWKVTVTDGKITG